MGPGLAGGGVVRQDGRLWGGARKMQINEEGGKKEKSG